MDAPTSNEAGKEGPELTVPQPLMPQAIPPYMPVMPCFNPAWLNNECDRLDIQNLALCRTIDDLTQQYEEMKKKLDDLENPETSVKKEKRKRRVAKEVPRHFACPHCDKAYG